WDDPRIKSLNPGLSLPGKAIAVVHRSDGSGTTFLFTDYLAKESADWADKVGSSTAVEWPVGIGAKGNEGVANMAKQTDGAIGYVEYAYAKQNHLTYAKLVNKAGKALEPGLQAFQAAAAGADWAGAKGFHLVLTDQPAPDAWPIVGASFILVHKTPADPRALAAALKFFDWAYKRGKDMATGLDYVPMPDNVVELVEKTWAEQIKDGGSTLWQ
ncbi:MAG TPA: phosphate ABC transporter substrate-binding protein PstS, partial [Dongiaceae bacterium]|nr:phosphate ABC transporter substrate-binding protein PstS [Dongiaceae bacterium]